MAQMPQYVVLREKQADGNWHVIDRTSKKVMDQNTSRTKARRIAQALNEKCTRQVKRAVREFISPVEAKLPKKVLSQHEQTQTAFNTMKLSKLSPKQREQLSLVNARFLASVLAILNQPR